MNEYIPIDKQAVPYRFEINLRGRIYEFEVHYNPEGDYFTVDLYKQGKMICLGEKITYGVPLFETIRDRRYPQVKITPLDRNRNKTKAGYKELQEDVFLYVEDL